MDESPDIQNVIGMLDYFNDVLRYRADLLRQEATLMDDQEQMEKYVTVNAAQVAITDQIRQLKTVFGQELNHGRQLMDKSSGR